MGFGTGHHETTFLMINKMYDLNFSKKSVLDMGCGTGILSILSYKMGANNVLGIDIDEWAYKNSLENLEQFSSINGPKFYGLDINKDTLTLSKTNMDVSEFTEEGNIRIKNFSINKKINWKVL
mgnify:CR=1 FL=1